MLRVQEFGSSHIGSKMGFETIGDPCMLGDWASKPLGIPCMLGE